MLNDETSFSIDQLENDYAIYEENPNYGITSVLLRS